MDEHGRFAPLPSKLLEKLKPPEALKTDVLHDKINIQETRHLLKKIKKTSSPGMDGITISKIINMSDYAFQKFGEAMNKVLDGRQGIGDILKTAYVSFIPKKKGYTEWELAQPNLFRPITVLPIINRILSYVINRRMQKLIVENCIISKSQRGFTQGPKTVEIPQAIRNLCKHAKATKNDIYITMVDYSDAYGSVIHQRLLEIMAAIGFPENSIRLIRQLVEGHGLHVKTHFGLTNRINLLKGIAQGDPIAPTFFNIYTELISRAIAHEKLEYQNNFIDFSILTYADDTTLISNSRGRAQKQLNTLVKTREKLGLTVKDKTKLTGFTHNNNRMSQVQHIKLQGNPLSVIPFNEPVKIVGYTFTADNSIGSAGKELIKKITQLAGEEMCETMGQ